MRTAIRSEHYLESLEGFANGFFGAVCYCGEDFAPYPYPQDAVDALMEHAHTMAIEAVEGSG